MHVSHLLIGGDGISFAQYARQLQFTDVAFQQKHTIGEELAYLIAKEWRSALFDLRYDEELQIRPIIHSMLVCAAISAEKKVKSNGGSREFLVLAEPSVEAGRPDRLSDEAVMEVVVEKGVFRIILEVKRSHGYSENFGESFVLPFSHVIQQVALALKSGKWEKEIICGIATRKVWFLFRVRNESTCGRLLLHIVNSYSILLQDPRLSTVHVQACLSFMEEQLRIPL